MLKRTIRWLFPPTTHDKDSWGNPNQIIFPWQERGGAKDGVMVGYFLVVVGFCAIVIALSILLNPA
jgi:hypothetical protein